MVGSKKFLMGVLSLQIVTSIKSARGAYGQADTFSLVVLSEDYSISLEAFRTRMQFVAHVAKECASCMRKGNTGVPR